jgi:hypothetical protein
MSCVIVIYLYHEFLIFYSKLSHPNVIGFWGIYTDDENSKYLVTEVTYN